MKKKVLCIFALIIWLMAALTFISMRVEEQMVPHVTLTGVMNDRAALSNYLPADCLFYDERGEHVYSIYEGTGWEAGERAREAGVSYIKDGDRLLVEFDYGDFIHYSSKPLRESEPVLVERSGSYQPDYWLAVMPQEGEGFAIPEELPEGVTVEEQNGTAVLFAVEKAQQPYMEGRALSQLQVPAGTRVYSFTEMDKFLDNLDAVGRVFGLLIGPVVLWILTCFMARNMEKYKLCVILNLGLGAVMLILLPFALNAMDLPSSLLPKEQITDFGYFFTEMDQFFGGLYSFAPPASEVGTLAANLPESVAGQEIIAHKNITIGRPLYHMILGVVLPAAAVVLERAVVYIRRMPKIK